jgi:hypothetical protein
VSFTPIIKDKEAFETVKPTICEKWTFATRNNKAFQTAAFLTN